MLRQLLTLLQIIAFLSNCDSKHVVRRSANLDGDDDINAPPPLPLPVQFQCPPCQAIFVSSAELNLVKMGCGPVTICNKNPSCTTLPAGPICAAKASYLNGVFGTGITGGVSNVCDQFTPPVQEHVSDDCQVIQVTAPSVQGVQLKIIDPGPLTNVVLKGVMKTPTGYAITACTIRCQQSTTTQQPPTQQPQQPPDNPIVPSGNHVAGGHGGGGGGGGGSTGNTGGGTGGTSGGSSSSKSSDKSSQKKSGEKQQKQQKSGEKQQQQQQKKSGEKQQKQQNNQNQQGSQGSPGSSGSSGTSGGTGAKHGSSVHTGQSHQGSHSDSHNSNGQGSSGSGGGGGGGGGGCFSSEMVVRTKSGHKKMSELQIGDEVLIVTQDQIESYQPVEWFYHRDKNALQTFVTVVTASNKTLSLTPNHLLTFVPCTLKQITLSELNDFVNYDSVFASKAKIGLCLPTKFDQHFEADPIVSVSFEKKTGVFSPITVQGTLIVNDVQVSCYSSVESHILQYGMHKFLLNLRDLLNMFKPWRVETTKIQTEIPSLVLFFKEIAELIVPSMVYQ